jgi:hypothetical protein
MGLPNTTNKNNNPVDTIIENLVEQKRIENEALKKFLLMLENEKAGSLKRSAQIKPVENSSLNDGGVAEGG